MVHKELKVRDSVQESTNVCGQFMVVNVTAMNQLKENYNNFVEEAL